MNKKILAAIFSMALLCSCGNGNAEKLSETGSESVSLASAGTSEATVTTTAAETTFEAVSKETESSKKYTAPQTEETTASEYTDTVNTETAASAMISKTITTKQTAAVQTEETTEQNKTTLAAENESDEVCEIPKIVFIFSHEYYTPNCFGFYITNEGLIKSFDFREISPDAYCYVGDIDVYNTLEDIGTDTDFAAVSKETLAELFELLLNISDDNEYECHSDDPSSNLEANGHYNFFAARFSENDEIQIIQLGEYGDFDGENSDPYANELFEKLKLLFPDPHEYLY